MVPETDSKHKETHVEGERTPPSMQANKTGSWEQRRKRAKQVHEKYRGERY